MRGATPDRSRDTLNRIRSRRPRPAQTRSDTRCNGIKMPPALAREIAPKSYLQRATQTPLSLITGLVQQPAQIAAARDLALFVLALFAGPHAVANGAPMWHNGTVLVPSVSANMPTSLTLKNIPDVVYERLKAAAELHRRSLNSEAIVCLESVLLPSRVAPGERLARARELRANLLPGQFTAKDIDAAKRVGRK
jgi:antitoxin FitA